MPINNIKSNAPESMRPYTRELEAVLDRYEERIRVLEAQVAALNRRS